jgi:hypothetical protein
MVLCHYILPPKSNFSGMAFMPIHYTLIAMDWCNNGINYALEMSIILVS